MTLGEIGLHHWSLQNFQLLTTGLFKQSKYGANSQQLIYHTSTLYHVETTCTVFDQLVFPWWFC